MNRADRQEEDLPVEGVGGAAAAVQRQYQLPGAGVIVAGRPGGRDQAPEPVQVDRVRIDVEKLTARAADEPYQRSITRAAGAGLGDAAPIRVR